MKLQANLKSVSQSGWQHGLLFFALLGALLLVWYGAEGVRGTDQYWYVADVERIVNGTPPVTNTYFPGEILRNNEVPEPNYIHHNSPMLYIVASIASMFSVYDAWIIANLISHLLVAFVIYSLSRKFTAAGVAALVTSFYLVSPIAIWQTINPLLEMYYSALVGLVLYCYFSRELKWATIALWFLLGLGVVSHPIFLVPALLYGLLWGWENRSSGLKYVLPACAVYFLVFYYLLGQKDLWFPSSFQPDLKAIIASAVPGKSNMFWHYSETLPVLNKELMVSKFVSALKIHTVEIRFIPFYVFTNLAIIAGMYLSVRHFRRYWPVILPLGVFGTQYILMILLQQNHPRFQQIVATVTFLCVAIVISMIGSEGLKRRLLGSVLAVSGLLICLVLVNGYMVHSAKQESIGQKSDIQNIIRQIGNEMIREESRILVVDVMPHNPMSYALRPAKVLFVRTSMASDSQIDQLIIRFKPDFIVTRMESPSYELKGQSVVGRVRSTRFGELVIYQVPSA